MLQPWAEISERRRNFKLTQWRYVLKASGLQLIITHRISDEEFERALKKVDNHE